MNRLVGFFFFCLLTSLSQALAQSPHELLIKGNEHFNKGEYKEALLSLESINVRKDLDNSEDMKLAFKIRAIAHTQMAEEEKALETIRELYYLDPAHRFDPFETPQAVLDLAEKELKAIESKNARLNSLKPKASKEEALEEKPSVLEKTVLVEKRAPFLTNFIPFGVNHFMQQSPIKGSIYLGLQTASLVTNIAAFWWKESYLNGFDVPRLRDQGYKSRFDAAQTTQYVALGAFVFSLAVSIIDALITYSKSPAQRIDPQEIKL
jgi:tetratricopeptide (TPR) repeat protein